MHTAQVVRIAQQQAHHAHHDELERGYHLEAVEAWADQVSDVLIEGEGQKGEHQVRPDSAYERMLFHHLLVEQQDADRERPEQHEADECTGDEAPMLVCWNTVPVATQQRDIGETGENGTHQTHQDNLINRHFFCHHSAKINEIEHLYGQIATKTKKTTLMLNTKASTVLRVNA